MRIVFMGTPEFSVPTLKLLSERYSVVGVYSQPPRPSGRGYSLTKSPVQLYAEQKDFLCFTPTTLKSPSIQEELRALKPDVIVVIAYGLILPQAVLDIPPLGCYNVHFSLLPRWRGAAPMQRALQAGDQITGVTIMKMDSGLDTGPILLQEKIPITSACTYESLSQSLATIGAVLMMKALEALFLQGFLKETSQPVEGITYAHKIKKEEGFLQWKYSANVLDHLIKAFNPWPGTSFMFEGKRIKILSAQVEDVPQGIIGEKPGTLIDDRLGIIGGKYNPFTEKADPLKILRPLLLQKPGGKVISKEEFLGGFPLPQGTFLD